MRQTLAFTAACRLRALAIAFGVAAAGCGAAGKGPADADIDGLPTDPDAGIDAPPPTTGNVRDLAGAGGRVTGGGLVLDVQLGHPFTHQPTTGGRLVFEGGAAVKP